jgi:hypothetical protein
VDKGDSHGSSVNHGSRFAKVKFTGYKGFDFDFREDFERAKAIRFSNKRVGSKMKGMDDLPKDFNMVREEEEVCV